MRYIDADKLTRDLIDNKCFYPAIVKRAIENAPTEDVVPRSEVDQAKQEVAIGIVEIISSHLKTIFNELQKSKIGANADRLIEINSKIAILEFLQISLNEIKTKYKGE